MEWYYLAVPLVALLGLYVIRNGSRNSDPMNRRCAAELCELAVSRFEEDIDGFKVEALLIFDAHNRYQSQAMHVASMVAPLLIRAGYPREFAHTVANSLTAVARAIPK